MISLKRGEGFQRLPGWLMESAGHYILEMKGEQRERERGQERKRDKRGERGGRWRPRWDGYYFNG